jgi:hypothetical protein
MNKNICFWFGKKLISFRLYPLRFFKTILFMPEIYCWVDDTIIRGWFKFEIYFGVDKPYFFIDVDAKYIGPNIYEMSSGIDLIFLKSYLKKCIWVFQKFFKAKDSMNLSSELDNSINWKFYILPLYFYNYNHKSPIFTVSMESTANDVREAIR